MENPQVYRARGKRIKAEGEYLTASRKYVRISAEHALETDGEVAELTRQERDARRALHHARLNLNKKLLRLRSLAEQFQQLATELSEYHNVERDTNRKLVRATASLTERRLAAHIDLAIASHRAT